MKINSSDFETHPHSNKISSLFPCNWSQELPTSMLAATEPFKSVQCKEIVKFGFWLLRVNTDGENKRKLPGYMALNSDISVCLGPRQSLVILLPL
jgi:hypothetical protein